MADIFHETFIEADAETVYVALTSQAGLAAWWTPKAMPESDKIWRFPFGANYYKAMEVQELVPAKIVKWACIHGADEWIGTRLSFELRSGDFATLRRIHPEAAGQLEQGSGGTGTMLAFSHADWADYTPMYAECNYTWGRFLWSLKLYCETGEGLPWPNQHRVGY